MPFGLFTAIYLVEYADGGRFSKAVTVAGRRDDRHPVDRRRPVRLRTVRADRRPRAPLRSRRSRRAHAADDPGRRPHVRGDAAPRTRTNSARRRTRSACRSGRRSSRSCCPTAIAGILTGIVLAIARVIGETAPLLVTVGHRRRREQESAVGPDDDAARVHLLLRTSSRPCRPRRAIDRAWTAALTLVIIVMVLFTTARILSSILKPKGLR